AAPRRIGGRSCACCGQGVRRQEVMRAAVCAAVALLLIGCGGSAKKKEAGSPTMAPAIPQAAAEMISGAEFARSPSGRERAIGLMREAIAIDPNLWEAHYDLGVLLAQGGDLAGAEPSLERAAKLSPNAEEIATALAQVRRRRGEQKKAAEGLQAF